MAIFSRRTVLTAGGGLVVLAAAGYGGSLVACNRASLAAALPLGRLDVALADIRAPERIGRSYRESVGQPAVEEAFLGKAGLVEAVGLDCPEARRAHIRAQVRADFAAGDVVLADRWVVARSECVVAALRAV